MSKLTLMLTNAAERDADCCGRVEPKRSLTEYTKLFDTGLKPRTNSRFWSGWMSCPQPRVFLSPCAIRSAMASGLVKLMTTFARLGSPIFCGLRFMRRLAVVTHGA